MARRAGSPATRKTYEATYRQLVAFAGPGAGPENLTGKGRAAAAN